NPRAAYVAAVDVTPARIEVAVSDITGTVAATHRLPRGGYRHESAAHRVRRAIAAAARQLDLDVGQLAPVTLAGPRSIAPRTGRLAYALHLPGWQDAGLVETLRATLRVPVDVENDVNLAAIAEQYTGAAQDCDDFALFWMGEGLGMAVVLDGELRRGAH